MLKQARVQFSVSLVSGLVLCAIDDIISSHDQYIIDFCRVVLRAWLGRIFFLILLAVLGHVLI